MTRIAVVNDDTVFLDMMAAVLSEYSWQVDKFIESSAAFGVLKAAPPDLIILDIRMERPENGWTLLELITLDPHLRRVPVIVCSAALFDLRAHTGWLEQNGIAVLPKPFNLDQLHDAVVRALAAPR